MVILIACDPCSFEAKLQGSQATEGIPRVGEETGRRPVPNHVRRREKEFLGIYPVPRFATGREKSAMRCEL